MNAVYFLLKTRVVLPRQIRLLALSLAAVAGWHAADGQGDPCRFRSGFEPGTVLHQYELNGQPHTKYADLYGTDTATGYDWVADLDGDPCMGNFRIYYQVGDTLRAKVSLAADPGDATNTVLRYQLFDANVLDAPHPRGRIQAAINPHEALYAFGFRVRMWLHPDLSALSVYDGSFGWFTLMEFWNDLPGQSWPFRIALNLVKPRAAVGSALRLRLHGQMWKAESWQDVWRVTDTSFTVPFGQWIHLYVSFVEGDSVHGRFQLALLDSAGLARSLFDVGHYTHHPDDPAPDGLQAFNPMKLYTFGNTHRCARRSGCTDRRLVGRFRILARTNDDIGLGCGCRVRVSPLLSQSLHTHPVPVAISLAAPRTCLRFAGPSPFAVGGTCARLGCVAFAERHLLVTPVGPRWLPEDDDICQAIG